MTTCKSLTSTKYVSVLYRHMIYRCSLLTKFANLSNVISDMAVTNVGSPEIFNTQLMVPNSNRMGGKSDFRTTRSRVPATLIAKYSRIHECVSL